MRCEALGCDSGTNLSEKGRQEMMMSFVMGGSLVAIVSPGELDVNEESAC